MSSASDGWLAGPGAVVLFERVCAHVRQRSAIQSVLGSLFAVVPPESTDAAQPPADGQRVYAALGESDFLRLSWGDSAGLLSAPSPGPAGHVVGREALLAFSEDELTELAPYIRLPGWVVGSEHWTRSDAEPGLSVFLRLTPRAEWRLGAAVDARESRLVELWLQAALLLERRQRSGGWLEHTRCCPMVSLAGDQLWALATVQSLDHLADMLRDLSRCAVSGDTEHARAMLDGLSLALGVQRDPSDKARRLAFFESVEAVVGMEVVVGAKEAGARYRIDQPPRDRVILTRGQVEQRPARTVGRLGRERLGGWPLVHELDQQSRVVWRSDDDLPGLKLSELHDLLLGSFLEQQSDRGRGRPRSNTYVVLPDCEQDGAPGGGQIDQDDLFDASLMSLWRTQVITHQAECGLLSRWVAVSEAGCLDHDLLALGAAALDRVLRAVLAEPSHYADLVLPCISLVELVEVFGGVEETDPQRIRAMRQARVLASALKAAAAVPDARSDQLRAVLPGAVQAAVKALWSIWSESTPAVVVAQTSPQVLAVVPVAAEVLCVRLPVGAPRVDVLSWFWVLPLVDAVCEDTPFEEVMRRLAAVPDLEKPLAELAELAELNTDDGDALDVSINDLVQRIAHRVGRPANAKPGRDTHTNTTTDTARPPSTVLSGIFRVVLATTMATAGLEWLGVPHPASVWGPGLSLRVHREVQLGLARETVVAVVVAGLVLRVALENSDAPTPAAALNDLVNALDARAQRRLRLELPTSDADTDMVGRAAVQVMCLLDDLETPLHAVWAQVTGVLRTVAANDSVVAAAKKVHRLAVEWGGLGAAVPSSQHRQALQVFREVWRQRRPRRCAHGWMPLYSGDALGRGAAEGRDETSLAAEREPECGLAVSTLGGLWDLRPDSNKEVLPDLAGILLAAGSGWRCRPCQMSPPSASVVAALT